MLLATYNTTLDVKLCDLRMQLVHMAAVAKKGKGVDVAVVLPPSGGSSQPPPSQLPPVNLGSDDVAAMRQVRLHPFDFTAPFQFVRSGGSVPIASARESELKLVDILPIMPPQGPTTNPKFCFVPNPGTVVRQVRLRDRHFPVSERVPSIATVREVVVVCFVRSGDTAEQLHSERVVMERLSMQNTVLGRSQTPKQLSTIVTKWNANVRDFIGRTVLQEAAQEGNAPVVRYLLSLPFVAVDEKDARGQTALHIAAIYGHMDVVAALLESGADPISSADDGETPLHAALYGKRDSIVDMLCRKLRSRNVSTEALQQLRDSFGRNAFDVFQLQSVTLEELCECDANDVARSMEALRALFSHYLFQRERWVCNDVLTGGTVLHRACVYNHLPIASFLLEQTAPHISDGGVDALLRTPLHVACSCASPSVVAPLLHSHLFDINGTDVVGRTPLHCALYAKNWDTAIALLRVEGIAVDVLDRQGLAPLHIAAGEGRHDVCEILIKLKASVNLRISTTVLSKTRVSQRVMSGSRRPKISKTRITKRRTRPPPVRYETRSAPYLGPSPLWCAVRCGRKGTKAALVLLSNGAARSENDTVGDLRTLLVLTLRKEMHEISLPLLKLLPSIEGEWELYAPFCVATSDRLSTAADNSVRWLLENSVGKSILCKNTSPLISCASVGRVEAVQLFLSYNKESANCGDESNTPLMLAAQHGHDAVARALILSGATIPSGSDGGGGSPLVEAARSGRAAMVRSMLGCRANPNSVSPDGTTALWVALFSAPARLAKQTTQLTAFEDCCMALVSGGAQLLDGHHNVLELLHSAASKHMWQLVALMLAKLSELPAETVASHLETAREPPVRPTTLVNPPVAASREPLNKAKKRKKKGIFPKPQPYQRLIIQAPDPAKPVYMQKYRDIFSYAAEDGQSDVIESLLTGIGIAPWCGPDLRGYNAADYAIAKGKYTCAVLLSSVGLAPLQTHAPHPVTSKIARLARAISTARTRPSASRQVDANDESGVAPLNNLLVTLAGQGCEDVLEDVIVEVLRRNEQDDLSTAGPWATETIAAAILHKHESIVETLITKYHCSCGFEATTPSPLLSAIWNKRYRCIDTLLRCPTLDCRSPQRLHITIARVLSKWIPKLGFLSAPVTPLFLAALTGQVDVMRALISRGATGECTAGALSDVLLAACLSAPRYPSNDEATKMISIVSFVTQHVPNVEYTATSLTLVAERCLTSVVPRILEKVAPAAIVQHMEDHPKWSMLHAAAKAGSLDVLASLLALGPTKKGTSKEEVSPLDVAIRHGNFAAALTLLVAGYQFSTHVIPVVCDPAGTSAAKPRRCHPLGPMMVQFLSCARLAVTQWQRSFLHAAIDLSCPGALEAAFEVGCCPPEVEVLHHTPFSLALIKGDNTTLQVLLKHNAVHLPAKSVVCTLAAQVLGLSSPHSARCGPCIDVLGTCLTNGADCQEPIDLSTYRPLRRLLEYRLNQELRPLQCGRMTATTVTPITAAALLNDEAACHTLLANGADPGCTNTTLHFTLTSTDRRREHYAVGKKWKLSALIAADSNESDTRRAESPDYPFISYNDDFVATPLLVALYHVSVLRGEQQKKASRVAQLLLDCGALEEPAIGVFASLCALARAWDLLTYMLEAASRQGFERSIRPLDSAPFVVKHVLGTVRHPLHAAVRYAPRDVLVDLIRHCRREDVEGCADSEGRTAAYHAVACFKRGCR